jgi:hypothetical protein
MDSGATIDFTPASSNDRAMPVPVLPIASQFLITQPSKFLGMGADRPPILLPHQFEASDFDLPRALVGWGPDYLEGEHVVALCTDDSRYANEGVEIS